MERIDDNAKKSLKYCQARNPDFYPSSTVKVVEFKHKALGLSREKTILKGEKCCP